MGHCPVEVQVLSPTPTTPWAPPLGVVAFLGQVSLDSNSRRWSAIGYAHAMNQFLSAPVAAGLFIAIAVVVGVFAADAVNFMETTLATYILGGIGGFAAGYVGTLRKDRRS